MKDVQEYKAMMEKRLVALKARLEKAEAVLTAEHTKDWDDQAIEREGDEVVEALSQNDLAEIARIEAALQRVTDGEYGKCVECGEAISPERLGVLPATPICRQCAQAHESIFENMPI